MIKQVSCVWKERGVPPGVITRVTREYSCAMLRDNFVKCGILPQSLRIRVPLLWSRILSAHQSLFAQIRMIRMRIGFESAYEDSEVRDEALRAYLLLG